LLHERHTHITAMSESKSAIQSEKLEDMKRAFKVFDKNDDGRISKDELKEVLKEAKVDASDEQMTKFMEKVDADGNGSLDFNEFCVMMNEIILESLDKTKQMREIFDAIDTNGDKKIQDFELKDALSQIVGDDVELEEAQCVIKAVDRDGDGHINFEEFVTMLHMLNLDETVSE